MAYERYTEEKINDELYISVVSYEASVEEIVARIDNDANIYEAYKRDYRTFEHIELDKKEWDELEQYIRKEQLKNLFTERKREGHSPYKSFYECKNYSMVSDYIYEELYLFIQEYKSRKQPIPYKVAKLFSQELHLRNEAAKEIDYEVFKRLFILEESRINHEMRIGI